MRSVGDYLITICAAAIFCSFIKCFLGHGSKYLPLIELLCAFFMIFIAINPLFDFHFSDINQYMDSISWETEAVSQKGKKIFEQERDAIITEQAEAYILDKAAALDAQVTVEVSLTDEPFPELSAVRIKGKISPAAKSSLEDSITSDLGIPKENQIWIPYP